MPSAALVPVIGPLSLYGAAIPPPAAPDHHLGSKMSAPVNGSAAQGAPSVTVLAAVASRVPAPSDRIYRGLYLLPNAIHAGNLIASLASTIELWNASEAGQAISAIGQTNADGISVAGDAVPLTIAALASDSWDVVVSADGPPTIDATLSWVGETNSPVLSIDGARVIVLPIRADWSSPLLCRLSWLTDIITGRDRHEQRIRIRTTARRQYEWQTILNRSEHRKALVACWDWRARTWVVPIWTDGQQLTAAIMANDQVVSLDTADRDFATGGYLVLWDRTTRWAVAEIQSVAAGSVATKTPLASWPVGTIALPGRLGWLQQPPSLSEVTDDLVTGRIVAELKAGTDMAGLPGIAPTQYRGEDVYLAVPNRAADLSLTTDPAVEWLDYSTGVIAPQPEAPHWLLGRVLPLVFQGRHAAMQFLSWLERRGGRHKSCWIPTWQTDLVMAQANDGTTLNLVIDDIGYRRHMDAAEGRRDIAILLSDGSWLFRRIMGAQAGVAGAEILTLDQSLGQALQPGGIQTISWLEHVRLGADQIEIGWTTDELAAATVRIQEVRE